MSQLKHFEIRNAIRIVVDVEAIRMTRRQNGVWILDLKCGHSVEIEKGPPPVDSRCTLCETAVKEFLVERILKETDE